MKQLRAAGADQSLLDSIGDAARWLSKLGRGARLQAISSEELCGKVASPCPEMDSSLPSARQSGCCSLAVH